MNDAAITTDTEEDIFGDLFSDGTDKPEDNLGGEHDAPDSTDPMPKGNTESNYSPNNSSCDSPAFSNLPMPQLTGSLDNYPKAYIELVQLVQKQYGRLPYVDFDAVYDEVAKLAIKSTPTPTLQSLNDELQRIQGAKDRLVEIYVNVIKCHNTKKRCTDVLQDAWGKYSDEKNAEKRKGDAAMCVSGFIVDLIEIETLMKYCSEIMKNLDSIQDTTSRRVTIMQSILKIDYFSRNALPDHDFKPKGEEYHNPLDTSDLDREILANKGSTLEAQEQNF